MLLNAGEEERTNVSRGGSLSAYRWAWCFWLSLLLDWASDWRMPLPQSQSVSTRDLSSLLFREYVFPFELTSFLILIALLGALVLARRETRLEVGEFWVYLGNLQDGSCVCRKKVTRTGAKNPRV